MDSTRKMKRNTDNSLDNIVLDLQREQSDFFMGTQHYDCEDKVYIKCYDSADQFAKSITKDLEMPAELFDEGDDYYPWTKQEAIVIFDSKNLSIRCVMFKDEGMTIKMYCKEKYLDVVKSFKELNDSEERECKKPKHK